MYSVFVEARRDEEPYIHICDSNGNTIKPFVSERYIIAYYGVLYNIDEVRNRLAEAGCSFVPDSAEGVVVYAYDLWREKCLLRLDGDFLFVIWDMLKKEIFFARDIYGIRPLFFLSEYPGFMLSYKRETIIERSDVSKAANIKELTGGEFGVFSLDGLKIQSYKSEYMCEALDILYDIFLTMSAPLGRVINTDKINKLIKDAENGSLSAFRIALYLIRLNYRMEKYNVDIL